MSFLYKISICTILFCGLLNIKGSRAQQLEISFNFESTEKLISIFDKGSLSDEDFHDLMAQNGTKAYLKKMESFFEDIDTNTFRNSLEKAVKGQPLSNDPFHFNKVVLHIQTVKELLQLIENNNAQLKNKSLELIRPYTPKKTKLSIEVYVVMGAIGGGWTFDDEPNTFYVDITSLKADFSGLIYLTAHEVFHLIQYRFMSEPVSKSNMAEFILDQVIREGSSTYLSDFSKLEDSGQYVQFNKKLYEKNIKRIKTNFALFEILIQTAMEGDNNAIDQLYNIGFSGMYQSPLYFVGYRIIETLEKYLGKAVLLNLMVEKPNLIFLKYQQLFNIHGANDSKIIPLSTKTIEILETMNNKN